MIRGIRFALDLSEFPSKGDGNLIAYKVFAHNESYVQVLGAAGEFWFTNQEIILALSDKKKTQIDGVSLDLLHELIFNAPRQV